MNVMELSREQIIELKGRFLDNLLWEKYRRGATIGEKMYQVHESGLRFNEDGTLKGEKI